MKLHLANDDNPIEIEILKAIEKAEEKNRVTLTNLALSFQKHKETICGKIKRLRDGGLVTSEDDYDGWRAVKRLEITELGKISLRLTQKYVRELEPQYYSLPGLRDSYPKIKTFFEDSYIALKKLDKFGSIRSKYDVQPLKSDTFRHHVPIVKSILPELGINIEDDRILSTSSEQIESIKNDTSKWGRLEFVSTKALELALMNDSKLGNKLVAICGVKSPSFFCYLERLNDSRKVISYTKGGLERKALCAKMFKGFDQHTPENDSGVIAGVAEGDYSKALSYGLFADIVAMKYDLSVKPLREHPVVCVVTKSAIDNNPTVVRMLNNAKHKVHMKWADSSRRFDSIIGFIREMPARYTDSFSQKAIEHYATFS